MSLDPGQKLWKVIHQVEPGDRQGTAEPSFIIRGKMIHHLIKLLYGPQAVPGGGNEFLHHLFS